LDKILSASINCQVGFFVTTERGLDSHLKAKVTCITDEVRVAITTSSKASRSILSSNKGDNGEKSKYEESETKQNKRVGKS
jgi:hypothetical protein